MCIRTYVCMYAYTHMHYVFILCIKLIFVAASNPQVEAALKAFDRYSEIMQNFVDPKVLIKLLLEHELITKDQVPGGPVILKAQMNFMLGIIRDKITVNNVEVFHKLLDCFKTVPDYATLARHLEG